MKKKLLITTAALTLALAAGGYFWFVYFPKIEAESTKKQELKINSLTQEAGSEVSELDYEGAIQKFQDLSALYAASGENALAVRQETRAAFLYNKSGNYRAGIPILKKIAFDETVANEHRAEALIVMGIAALGSNGRGALEEIFGGESNPILVDALAGGDPRKLPDLERALFRLFDSSKKLHDFSYASYVSAAAKSTSFAKHNKEYSKEERARITHGLVQLIAHGDKLARAEMSSPEFREGSFIYDIAVSGGNQRLNALTQLTRVDRGFEPAAKKQYDASMEAFKSLEGASALGSESYIRFYYASMLADLYGAKKRSEISEIILPTISATGDRGKANKLIIWPFYELQLTRPKSDRGADEQFILNIASVVPAFDQFLKNKGWKK